MFWENPQGSSTSDTNPVCSFKTSMAVQCPNLRVSSKKFCQDLWYFEPSLENLVFPTKECFAGFWMMTLNKDLEETLPKDPSVDPPCWKPSPPLDGPDQCYSVDSVRVVGALAWPGVAWCGWCVGWCRARWCLVLAGYEDEPQWERGAGRHSTSPPAQ